MLNTGEVVMSSVWATTGAVASLEEGAAFNMIFDGRVIELDLFGIPKGSLYKDEAIEFIRFASSSNSLANMVTYLRANPLCHCCQMKFWRRFPMDHSMRTRPTSCPMANGGLTTMQGWKKSISSLVDCASTSGGLRNDKINRQKTTRIDKMTDQTTSSLDNLVAKSGLFAGMNPLMGIASMVMIIGFVGFTISDVESSSQIFSVAKNYIITSLDWFYVLVVNAALFFVLWLLISRFGDVKLGKPDDEPDFSTFSWICMLFSAGLGSGLIYWGVAEPMYHIQGSPFLEQQGIEPGSTQAAISAVVITNFHWGFHGWGLYVLVGLSLAYFAYRSDLPLTLRTALYPVLKDRIYGPW